MDVKIKKGQVVSMKLKDKEFLLRDVNINDLSKFAEFIEYLEDHMVEGEYEDSWTKEEIIRFLDTSTENQRVLLKLIVSEPEGIMTKDIIGKLGWKNSQVVAGMMAGFTRRTKSRFGNKERLIQSEWSDEDWQNKYWINEKYREEFKEYFRK